MPQGYYTIEQWRAARSGAAPQWVAVAHLPFGLTQTDAEAAVQQLGKPGFYRLVQTQRVLWAEKEGGDLRLRKSHASSPESLDKMRQMFERTGGKYPLEEVQAARREQKKKQARKA